MTKPTTPNWALEIAAQCWCDPTTSMIEMDSRLAEVFAAKLAELAPAPTDVAVLPDGSAFFTASYPLPKDHWLFAPGCEQWDAARDVLGDMPHPILEIDQRPAVITAMRWAIRTATRYGRDMDFDPDALALNAAFALCGPAALQSRANRISQLEAERDALLAEDAPANASVQRLVLRSAGTEG
jgi:hypothetical protein